MRQVHASKPPAIELDATWAGGWLAQQMAWKSSPGVQAQAVAQTAPANISDQTDRRDIASTTIGPGQGSVA